MLNDPAEDTKVTADVSSYNLGAVIMQRQDSQWKPIAYASRSMNETEQRYTQIKKEAHGHARSLQITYSEKYFKLICLDIVVFVLFIVLYVYLN